MSAAATDAGAAAPLTPEGEAFVRAIGSATDLPAFVRNVRAISSLATDMRTRVAMLENAITQDVALSAKVLRIANAVSRGTQVASVKQAIMLLGYDRVQHLSSAAAVYEQVEQSAPAVQDLLVMSVLTANQGLCLAVEAGFARPETAYLCGLFRNLGELLVACYRPAQYRECLADALTRPHAAPGDEERVLGFTFDSVGRALAQKWGMSADIVRTMAHRTPPAGESTDPLADIVGFAAQVTRTRYAARDGEDAALAEHELVGAWTRTLGLDRAAIDDALAMAEVEAGPTLSGMRVALDGWREERRAAAAARVAAAAVVDEDAALAALAESLAPVADDTPAEAAVRDAVRRLTEERRGESFDVANATGATLAAVQASGFPRVLLALVTDDGRFVRGRVASGPGADALERHFVVRPVKAFGALGAALEERRDVFAVLEGEGARAFARDRVLRELRPRAFAMLPLALEDRLLGCLYFDHPEAVVEPTETLQSLLRHARDQLVAAFRARRGEREVAGGDAAANGGAGARAA